MENLERLFFEEYFEPGVEDISLVYTREKEPVYADGRQVLVRMCNDALVEYPNKFGERGLVLVTRREEPAKEYIWGLGGGVERGFPLEESLAKKVKEESGLEIYDIRFLCFGRFFLEKYSKLASKEKNLPLGIDEFSLLFYGKGKGNLKLNELHEMPMIITSKEYTPEFRESLHPFIQRGMDLAMPFLKG